jgi:pyruvate dehydrogenase E2 component (dihydrolipoamide acetyltransferase)
MADIVMPRLSDSMEEGTILKWLKSAGDEIAVGDELVEIETDKANMVYEADTAGTLVEIVAEEGDTLPIGEPIARVGDAGEAPAPEKKESRAAAAGAGPAENGGGEAPAEEAAGETEQPEPPAAAPPTPSPATTTAEPAAPASDGAGDGRVKASPIARRLARDKGLDLHALSGSGPGGRIVKADVERAAESGAAAAPQAGPPPAAAPTPTAPPAAAPAGPTPGVREKPETAKGQVEVVEPTKVQQTIARRMAESKATAPHFYLQAELDMSAAFEGRKRLKEMAGEDEVVPTFNDMVIKACALALREHPRANAAYRDGHFEFYSRVNVGVAVAAPDALIVPTVFDADLKGLRQIATETRALASRVRTGSITPPELSGATFTVSNLGMYGISNFHAVINTPQAAILAIGELKAKPVVDDDGSIVARQMMGVTLACDHRILYGADGALFLKRVRALLEEPIALAL